MPATMVSPDGNTFLDVWVRADEIDGRLVNVRVTRGTQWQDHAYVLGPGAIASPYVMDPDGEFISNDVALVAATRAENSLLEPIPASTEDPDYLPAANHNAAIANVYLHPAVIISFQTNRFPQRGTETVEQGRFQ